MRPGFILPVVLATLLVMAILLLGIWTLVTGEIRQTRFVTDDTVQLYAADGVLARELNRLKAAPWTRRWYAKRDDPGPGGSIDRGRYRGFDTYVVAQDVVDGKGAPVANLTDIFVQVAGADGAMSYACRTQLLPAGELRPNAVHVRQWVRTSGRIDTVDGREKARAQLAAAEDARERNRHDTAALVREAQAKLADYGANTARVVRELSGKARGERKSESDFGEKLRAGDAALFASPPRVQAAVEAYTEAVSLADAQRSVHREENKPRAIERLAMAKLFAAEVDPLGSGERRSRMTEAREMLEKLAKDFEKSPVAPRALLRRAWSMLKEAGLEDLAPWNAARRRCRDALDDLAGRYGSERLFHEDRTVSATCALLRERLERGMAWTQGGRLKVARVEQPRPLKIAKASTVLVGLGAPANVRWSGDGSGLALDAEVAPGKRAVFTCEASGLDLRRWTPDEWGDCRSGGFSPDGTRLAFSRTKDGKPEVCTIAVDGTDPQVIGPGGTDPAWVGAGGAVIYSAGGALWQVPPRGGEPQQITTAEAGGMHARPASASDGSIFTFIRLSGEAGPVLTVGPPVEAEPGTTPIDRTPAPAFEGTEEFSACTWYQAEQPCLIVSRKNGAGGALLMADPESRELITVLESPGEPLGGGHVAPVPAVNTSAGEPGQREP